MSFVAQLPVVLCCPLLAPLVGNCLIVKSADLTGSSMHKAWLQAIRKEKKRCVCMRVGRQIPEDIWAACEDTFASGIDLVLAERHTHARFCHGYGLHIYWAIKERRSKQSLKLSCYNQKLPIQILLSLMNVIKLLSFYH